MKKLIFTLSLTMGLITAGSLSAQNINIGINGAGALPLGDLGNATNFGLGGDLSLDYYFNDRFDLGIEAGLRSFALDPAEGSFTVIPVLLTAGLHQDINDWIDLYGELGLGAYITDYEIEVPTIGTQNTTGTYLGFSPRVGLAFELSSVFFLDVSVKYNYVLSDADFGYNYNYLGLNLGLLYTLKEF